MSAIDRNSIVSLLARELAGQPKGSGRTGLPVAWASSRGLVREENQDRLVVAHSPSGLSIAVLADGMGGMKDGARAATTACAAVVAHFMAHARGPLEGVLADALNFANDEVFRALRGDGGAALVAAAWGAGDRCIAHAGDARAYQIDDSGRLQQLTVDDTVKGQLEQLKRLSTGESDLHSQLLQFIGVGKDLEPHVARTRLGGRGVVLTSDGVHSLPHAVMEWIVQRTGHLQAVAERLVGASEWNGGQDNGSVIAVSFQNGHTTPAENAEFWTPNAHLIVLPDEPTRPVHHTESTKKERGRLQSSKSVKRRRRRDSMPLVDEHVSERGERQLPIVEFEDPSASAADTAGDADRESSGAGKPKSASWVVTPSPKPKGEES